MKKHVILAAAVLGTCLATFVVSSAIAAEYQVRGSYLDDDGSLRGAWSGQLELAGSSVRGSLSMPGMNVSGNVEGFVDLDEIDFSITGPSGVQAFFSGKIVNGGLKGSYTVGGRRGTWTGEWSPLPGKPPRTISDEELAGPVPEIYQQPAEDIVDDAGDVAPICRLLGSQRALRHMSAARVRSLQRMCSPVALDAPTASAFRWSVVANAVRERIFGWLLDADPVGVTFPAVAQQPPVNRLVNNPTADTYPRNDQSEPSVAASGATNGVLVVAFNDFGQIPLGSYVGFARSTDGGSTYTDKGVVPTQSGYTIDGDPVVASDSAGRFFINHADSAYPNCFIRVSRSTDGGSTFGTPATANDTPGNSHDKPFMAVDRRASGTYSGQIYVCWNEYQTTPPYYSRIRFARSTNHGDTYERPTGSTNITGYTFVDGCSLAIGPQGHVYVAWVDLFDGHLKFKRSTDGGASFGSIKSIAPVLFPVTTATCSGVVYEVHNGNIRDSTFANIAADPLTAEVVYAAWNGWTVFQDEALFKRSTDGGTTWPGEAMLVNDEAVGDQFSPSIAVGVRNDLTPVSSEVKIIWYDRRNDPNNLKYEVFADSSFDNGQNWGSADERWTDTAAPIDLPPLLPRYDCDASDCYFGDYIAVAPTNPWNNYFVGTWGDHRTNASGTPCGSGKPSSAPDPNIRAATGY
jgi:hypothetical protein